MLTSFLRKTANYLLNIPILYWILLGFLITFVSFFVIPIFFDPSLEMQFKVIVPVVNPVGWDFRQLASASYDWLHFGKLPEILYPPFTLIFFGLFTLTSLETGYKIWVTLILICYLLTTLVLPRAIHQRKEISSFEILISVSGIVSYGFQFELASGQWNLVAFSFTLLAIYLFHRQPKYRWLSYLLFTISIQLKLYPAIFFLMFIEDFSDVKNNIKRIAGLGIANIAAFFIFGFNNVLNIMNSLKGVSGGFSQSPTHIRASLSIVSFINFFFSKGILPHKRIIYWIIENKWLPESLIIAVFGLCFLIVLYQAYKKNTGFNPYVFMICMVGACIIPTISFDYKLSILPASFIVSAQEIFMSNNGKQRPTMIISAFIFSIAYSSTLYPFVYKPLILENSFPALIVLLLVITLLSYMDHRLPTRQTA